jgi:hypothetical protein
VPRYLGGRPALLAESQAEWDRFVELVDRLWSMSGTLVPLNPDEKKRIDTANPDAFDERMAERVQRLADDARVSTFERIERRHAPWRSWSAASPCQRCDGALRIWCYVSDGPTGGIGRALSMHFL